MIIGSGFATGYAAGAYARQLRESQAIPGTQIFFEAIEEIEVYENAYVFVKNTGGGIITKVLFASLDDAKLFADALLTLTYAPVDAQNTLEAQEKIPLAKVSGVYTLPVTVNGVLALHFILDTGASEVVIPADVALTLVRTGTIQDSDFLPGADYTLADGSVVSSPRFILIGQNVLERFGAWGIDNKNKVLILGAADPSGRNRDREAMSLAGNWRGAWGSSRASAGGSLTASFLHAGFALKGQMIITKSACFTSGEMFGTVIGEVVVFRVDFGRGQWADLTGTVSSDGRDMRGQYIVNGGRCGDDVGTWSFKSM
jgi:hypothetical protein